MAVLGGGSIWAIDVGQSSLKGLNATKGKNGIVIETAVLIEYPQLVDAAGPAERDQMIADAVDKFVEKSGIKPGERVALSIPSVGAIVRFISLPPVQRSQIPEIVRYEARQQIPFPLEESIWDYQLVERDYEPGEELEVGLFAVRRENVYNILYHFEQRGFNVELIQLAPIAVYNFVRAAGLLDTVGVVISVGAACTDLIIADNKSLLVRSLPVAGNDMTRTLQEKLRVSFMQAENLKRRSATIAPEQAKRMLGVMLPILQTFVAEIQRTLGYYRSQVRSIKVSRIIALGSGAKIRGFRQYLAKRLEVPVEAVLGLGEGMSASSPPVGKFLEKNAPAFGAALGLAAQGLGQTENRINLTPAEILRKQTISAKRPFVAAIAACCMLAVLSMWVFSNRNFKLLDRSTADAYTAFEQVRGLQQEVDKYKDVWPYLGKVVMVRRIATQQRQFIELYSALGDLLPPDVALSGIEVRVTRLKSVRELIISNSHNQEVVNWVNSTPDHAEAEVLYVRAAGVLQGAPGTDFIGMMNRIDEINQELKSKREFAGFLIPPEKVALREGTNSLDLKEITWFIIPPG